MKLINNVYTRPQEEEKTIVCVVVSYNII